MEFKTFPECCLEMYLPIPHKPANIKMDKDLSISIKRYFTHQDKHIKFDHKIWLIITMEIYDKIHVLFYRLDMALPSLINARLKNQICFSISEMRATIYFTQSANNVLYYFSVPKTGLGICII